MTETAKQKIAVILRGPPAIGKSSVTKLLAVKMLPGSTKQIDLDQGWGKDENRRCPPAEGRYADLLAQEDLLVLELGCGEPAGWLFEGATRNPREWVEILEREGREIHAFLLWTDYETWQRRLLTKVPAGDPGAHDYYRLFERDEWKQFSTKAGIREEYIDTTRLREQGIADRIWQRIQIRSAGRRGSGG